jgi:rhodanese-related sulfurtransferase
MKRRQQIWIQVMLLLLVGVSGCMASAEKVTEQSVSPRQFKLLLDEHRGDPDVVLLDVRTPQEYKNGHIEGALLVDFYANDFVDRLKALDREKSYLIYCRSGNRSAKTLAIFEKLGFQHSYHLATGIKGWSREEYPLVRVPER